MWSRLCLCFSSSVLFGSPPFLIWEPVSCSTPALEFFPMSAHTSNTSWQAQKSPLRIPIPNNYSISYTPTDLFPALRLIKRSLWPVNNAVDLLINLPLVGRSEYSNAYICLIYKNEQRWCRFLELRMPEEHVLVVLTLSLSLYLQHLAGFRQWLYLGKFG